MNKTIKINLLQGVNASNTDSADLDDLAEDDGLNVNHVEVKLLTKPHHGRIAFDKPTATVAYTPNQGFQGEETITASVKLADRPEIIKVTHKVSVELSPGAQYERSHKYENCAEARAAGATPIEKGDPGYGPHLDADSDGIGCDWG